MTSLIAEVEISAVDPSNCREYDGSKAVATCKLNDGVYTVHVEPPKGGGDGPRMLASLVEFLQDNRARMTRTAETRDAAVDLFSYLMDALLAMYGEVSPMAHVCVCKSPHDMETISEPVTCNSPGGSA